MPDESLKRLILVIDQNPDHGETMRQVLADQSDRYHLQVIDSGEAAIAWVQSPERVPSEARPDLILLDLHLPNQASFTILTTLKGNADWRRIPVIMLSESGQTDDVFQSYFHQGNCYIVKSRHPQQLAAMIQQIESFWLEIVTLPT
ncbi:MAG: response regulator [Leptolyngbya sp.]|nr:response regulator [Leptolyngbya sp.]